MTLARKIAVGLAILPCGTLILGGWYFASKRAEIRAHDERYDRLQAGDSRDNVVSLFGAPDRVVDGPCDRFDDIELKVKDDPAIVLEYRYTVDTFFLPITWAFGFDENGEMHSKHRYD